MENKRVVIKMNENISEKYFVILKPVEKLEENAELSFVCQVFLNSHQGVMNELKRSLGDPQPIP